MPVAACANAIELQAVVNWMQTNPEGGLVVFITCNSEFLRDVTRVHEADGFTAELLYVKEDLARGPGMREKVVRHYEWIDWLREQMQRPRLQMHALTEAEWEQPNPQAGTVPRLSEIS